VSSSAVHDNLPLQLTRFIGRDAELAQLPETLRAQRLVTLVGPGGVGKTRLSLEVAARARRNFADGVCLVELASLADPGLVPQAVAAPLGVRAEAQVPLLQTLLAHLANRQVLLLLDNCEHLVVPCASLANELLRWCPELRILATSRQPLRTSGEWIWRVSPLDVPAPGATLRKSELLDFAAVRLFVDRASAAAGFELADSDTASVTRVCQRLDGIPLALELAAARVAALGMAQLAERLDDALRLLVEGSRTAPLRHQTLQATLDWSYALLDQDEQLLLDRLAVFAGGFSTDAVEAICASPELDVTRSLASLVEKSLVVVERSSEQGMRYRLQEVVHQYAAQRLEQQPELNAIRARHADFFRGLVEQAEPRVLRGEREHWQDRLELDLDNLRAARTWFVCHVDADSALRLNAYLFLLLAYRGYASEGRASLREALSLPGGTIATRARALHCLALLAYLQADYVAAAEYGEESLTLRREVADAGELSWSLLERGSTASAQAQYAIAKCVLEEARETSRGYVHAYSISLLGQVAYLSGDFRLARVHAQSALDASQSAGFIAPTSNALATLGETSAAEGDHEAAQLALEAALDLARAPGEAYLVGRPVLALALLTIDAGDLPRARPLLTESVGLARRLGNPHRVAQSLEGVAAYAARRGQSLSAWRFVSAADAIRGRIGAPLGPTERSLLDARLHSVLPARAADDGRAWSLEQACAAALAVLRADAAPPGRLTPREYEVASLVAQGLTNREIARSLTVAERTAISHVEHVLDKLGFHSRAQIATWVTEQSSRIGREPDRPNLSRRDE
jgi:predicted ATPase/DNA-binding CsgD family transcriptional regulator